MAKRRYLQHTDDNANGNEDSTETTTRRVVSVNQKMICHVFESDEVSFNKNFKLYYGDGFFCKGSINCSFNWTSISSSIC